MSAVKLDGSLVQSLANDEVAVMMVRAMTDLAHAMNVVVIAPLIEDATSLQLLQGAGADCAQGFVLGMPSDEWAELEAQ